jgi:hypothetical protein
VEDRALALQAALHAEFDELQDAADVILAVELEVLLGLGVDQRLVLDLEVVDARRDWSGRPKW